MAFCQDSLSRFKNAHPTSPTKMKAATAYRITAIGWTRMWCLPHKSQYCCEANTPSRGGLNACAARRAATNADGEPSECRPASQRARAVSGTPAGGTFLRLRVTIFSGLLRPGLSDYERWRPEVLEKNVNPLSGPRMCSGEKIKGEFLPSASTSVRAKLVQVHSRFAVD
jgi:hypothetical protein